MSKEEMEKFNDSQLIKFATTERRLAAIGVTAPLHDEAHKMIALAREILEQRGVQYDP